MFGLPSDTVINRPLRKETLYVNASLKPRVREIIKDQIESVVVCHKLADGWVSKGETVEEILIFEVKLRQRKLNKHVLPAIAQAIPYKILFILTFGDEAQAWIEASDTFYHTDWLPFDGFMLKFEGLNLDAVYENLARQIAGGRLAGGGSIAEAVEIDKRRRKLEREIAVLEKKVASEKQFNRQVELNGELKRLRAELEDYL